MRIILFSALVAAGLAPALQAQTAEQFAITGGLSTFGANLEASYKLNPMLRMRGALMGGIAADFDETDPNGVTSRGEAELGGFALLADYYPTGGAWRLSGGLFMSNTDLNATGTVDLAVFGAVNATLAAEFANDVAPMITLGYDYAFGGGWALSSEIGAVGTGGIDVRVTANDPTLQAQIDNDADVQELIRDADDIVAYPYLALGISYAF